MRYPFRCRFNHTSQDTPESVAVARKPLKTEILAQRQESEHLEPPGIDRDDPRTYFKLVILTSFPDRDTPIRW